MPVEPGLVDANILVYAINADALQHAPSRALLEAVRILSALLALPGLHVLASPKHAVTGLMELLLRHPVTGGDVFDLQIVATMQANNIQRIYTFNTGDFAAFPELAVITP